MSFLNFVPDGYQKSILDNVYDKKILTLITCTNFGKQRLVVKAREI